MEFQFLSENHGIPLQVCINGVMNAAKWLEWQMFYMQESLLSEQAIKQFLLTYCCWKTQHLDITWQIIFVS